jgi:replication factor A1
MERMEVVPVRELSTMKDWAIEVRLIKKDKVKLSSNRHRETYLLPLEFIDRYGTIIYAKLFGSRINTHPTKLLIGNCYLIADGTLRISDKRLKINHSKYTITLCDRSCIKELHNKEDIPMFVQRFTELSEIDDLPIGTYIDIIGIPRQVFSPKLINLKNGNNSMIRCFKLFDGKGRSIPITLWGYNANISIEENKVMAFEELRVYQYKGRNQLGSTSRTKVIKDINEYDTTELQSWIIQNLYDNPNKSLRTPQAHDDILVFMS